MYSTPKASVSRQAASTSSVHWGSCSRRGLDEAARPQVIELGPDVEVAPAVALRETRQVAPGDAPLLALHRDRHHVQGVGEHPDLALHVDAAELLADLLGGPREALVEPGQEPRRPEAALQAGQEDLGRGGRHGAIIEQPGAAGASWLGQRASEARRGKIRAKLPPQRIGKYEVVGKIGQGAMGEVFRAHDPVLNRDVAIKRISAGLDTDEMVRKRFQREAQSAALLSHPNIITVYELGFEGEQLFMAMELLDGIDLKHVLTGRKMTLDEKLEVVEQICEGLAFAHAHEIVHRDLKPANIHVLPSGKVKIMDFGLARLSGSEMTSTGMVMGTPHYMSPEQVRGAKADARSDVFALGCVLYEILTGRKPFDAESMHAVLFKIMQEEPVPLREAAPGTPEALVQVVDRALAKNPAERFENAGDMLVGIRQAQQAVAAGRGHERVPGLERPPAGPPPPGAGRAPARERSHASAVPRNTVPPATAPGSHWPLLLGLGLALAAVLGGAWALRGYVLGGPATPPAPPAGVSQLAQRAIDSQVELARRKLEAGELADAVRQAEGALKLDPQNASARQVLDEAAATLRRIDEALAAVRAAGTDRERLARRGPRPDGARPGPSRGREGCDRRRQRVPPEGRGGPPARAAGAAGGRGRPAPSAARLRRGGRSRAPGRPGPGLRPGRLGGPPLPGGPRAIRAGRARLPPVAVISSDPRTASAWYDSANSPEGPAGRGRPGRGLAEVAGP